VRLCAIVGGKVGEKVGEKVRGRKCEREWVKHTHTYNHTITQCTHNAHKHTMHNAHTMHTQCTHNAHTITHNHTHTITHLRSGLLPPAFHQDYFAFADVGATLAHVEHVAYYVDSHP